MTNVQEAAARLRRIHKGDSPIDVYGFDPNVNDRNDPYVLDLRFALGQWLELVPADDAEPIDEAYLRSSGFTLDGGRWMLPVPRSPLQTSVWHVVVHDAVYCLELCARHNRGKESFYSWLTVTKDHATRGDLRALLKGLKLPLSESPAKEIQR